MLLVAWAAPRVVMAVEARMLLQAEVQYRRMHRCLLYVYRQTSSIDACIGAYCMYTGKRQASGPLADPVVSKPCSSDRALVPLITSKLLCAALGVQAVHRMQASQDSSSQ
jgi:hypothetical protein